MKCYEVDVVSLMKHTEKKLLYHVVISILGFCIFSYVLYVRRPVYVKEIPVIIQEILALLFTIFLIFSEVSFTTNVISRTAMKIEIGTGEVWLYTTPIDFLWIHKPSAILKYRKGEFTLKKVSYPIVRIFSRNERVLRLNNRGVHTYILSGYFGPEVEDNIMSIRG